MHRFLPTLLTAIALFSACTHEDSPPLEAPSATEPEVRADVEAAVAPAPFGTPSLPGAIVGVARGGRQVYAGAFGVARLGADAPPDPGASSRIGSVTKAFVATTVLRTVAGGPWSLDTPLASLLPSVDDLGAVTVGQALQHMSGLTGPEEVALVTEIRLLA
jgi:CubicO group peptidase (beta-lactamase class C family)